MPTFVHLEPIRWGQTCSARYLSNQNPERHCSISTLSCQRQISRNALTNHENLHLPSTLRLKFPTLYITSLTVAQSNTERELRHRTALPASGAFPLDSNHAGRPWQRLRQTCTMPYQ